MPSRVTTRRTRISSCGGAGAGGGIATGSGLAGGGGTARVGGAMVGDAGGGALSLAATTGVGLATVVSVNGFAGGVGRAAASAAAGAIASCAIRWAATKEDASAGASIFSQSPLVSISLTAVPFVTVPRTL